MRQTAKVTICKMQHCDSDSWIVFRVYKIGYMGSKSDRLTWPGSVGRPAAETSSWIAASLKTKTSKKPVGLTSASMTLLERTTLGVSI